ncbi:MAG TPA: M43 family zinc metalloprotease [Verrucomicrobiota bacterium]|nr:M43 family zinc metalloprotease [Verrucomicrobiota bacterium]
MKSPTSRAVNGVYLPVLVLLLLAATLSSQAQYIEIRVSTKFILNGSSQPPTGGYTTSNQWRQAIDTANAGNARFGRGFRYQYPSFDGSVNGYSQYYNLDQSEAVPFEYSIRTNAAQTGWRADALNVYIVNRNLGPAGNEWCAGWASNPEDALANYAPYNTMNGRIAVFCAGVQGAPGSELSIVAHEFGHHMGLIHTWADDRVADTVVDADPTVCEQPGVPDWCSCKFNNTLARAAQLGWSAAVLRVATNNIMSYHCDNDLDFDLTEGQLDRWADIARRYLASEMTGVTYFVDRNNAQGGNDGYSTNPYRLVQTGVTAATATSGNIVMIRPGNYDEQFTISKPVTLRATRSGWVTIGKP